MTYPVPPLEFLIAELTCGDPARSEEAAVRLAEHGPAAVEALLQMLASPLEDSRWWGVRALADMDGDAARTAVRRALGDPEASVRQCAALGLRRDVSPADAPGLVAALSDPDTLVRRLAGDALAALGAHAVAPLDTAAHSSDPSTRIEAVRALARCGSPDAIPALMSALDDPSSLVGYWAVRGLEDLGPTMVYFSP